MFDFKCNPSIFDDLKFQAFTKNGRGYLKLSVGYSCDGATGELVLAVYSARFDGDVWFIEVVNDDLTPNLLRESETVAVCPAIPKRGEQQ